MTNIKSHKMTRILHVIASVDPKSGGPIEGIIQQAAQRRPTEYEVNIACIDSPAEGFVSTCPVKTYALGPKLRRPAWMRWLPWIRYGYVRALVPWLKHNVQNYDIVIVNGLWNYATYACKVVLPKSDRPYVVFTHGMLDPWFKKTYPLKTAVKQIFWWFCEGPLLKHAGAVLFTTDEERILARNAFWPYKVTERVVGYGCGDVPPATCTQLSAFRELTPGLGDKRYLLFLSRIHPKKGCDLLIKAFSGFAKSNPDIDLVIAGPDQIGWLPKLRQLAIDLGVDSRIHFPGMIQGDAKWGAFSGAEAFVLPSHQENFGIVVAEAMALGKPVLITNKVNIWREVESAGAGLVETDDEQGISRLLSKYASFSEDQRLDMAARARQSFLANFEMRNAVVRIDEALHELIARFNRRA